MKMIERLSELQADYDGFLFDAYGVLVDESGPISGAIELLEALQVAGKPFWILSNGSSRLEPDLLERYRALGFSLHLEQLITSGGLLRTYFKQHQLGGAPVAVLGPEGSVGYVKQAGGKPVAWFNGAEAAVIVIANQTGFPLLDGMDRLISYCISRIDQELELQVIVTNPDLIYPKSQNLYGITAGSLALVLEESLVLRFGNEVRSKLVRLGKPFSPIFDEAVQRAKSDKLLMIGDQLMTDVKGARDYGIDSLLVGTGLTPPNYFSQIPAELRPTFACVNWEQV